MQKILIAQNLGNNSTAVPLKSFGVVRGKKYLVTKKGEEIIIKEYKEGDNANL